jgi:branched-chain amino acid transport system ATP-binding protein
MSRLLEGEKVSKHFGGLKAVDAVDFYLSEGEILGLIGPNGAGKTTLFSVVAGSIPPSAGLQRPTKGDIRFEGKSLMKIRPHERVELGITLVPEGRELWPQMNVKENLELGAFCGRARGHVAESLDRVFSLFPHLKDRCNQMAGSLSGGEQQMCAIGRALMSRPRLIMFDEPSLGLAPILVSQVFDTIHRLHSEEGLTVLLVEQNLTKALEIADRGYVIETGMIKTEGTSRQLLDDASIRSAYLGI